MGYRVEMLWRALFGKEEEERKEEVDSDEDSTR